METFFTSVFVRYIYAEIQKLSGILDYSNEELELFSKVETIDYYTTVLKISGLDIPAVFYYPEHADDPASMGRFVAMQRFYADTDIFLFWSFGTAEVHQQRVTELLYEDVEKMGGRVETLILQRKWRYFPHIRSPGAYLLVESQCLILLAPSFAQAVDFLILLFRILVPPLTVRDSLDHKIQNIASYC